MGTFGARRERLLELARGFDSVVVTDPRNLFYLTDFWGGGIGVLTRGSMTIVTSAMEKQRAEEDGRDVLVEPATGIAAAYEAAKELSTGRVVTDRYDRRVRGRLSEGIFLEVRRTKDSEEIRRISEASERVESLYGLLERSIRPGRSEREVAGDLMRLATEEGLSPLAAEGSLSPIILASGPHAALPHAELTDRRMRSGDMVVADIFFRYRGYCTDCTRTYALGRVSREARAAYEAVLEAQEAGTSAVIPGVRARDVHAVVGSVLERKGLARYFTHGTGHGVGIEIHERPSLSGSSEDVLMEGDVVTVEPGVYVPGRYGVRIEDTLVVGRTSRTLFGYTKELLVL